MKLYSWEPINYGNGYSVLAESEKEAMIYIRDYLFNLAEKEPFGTANNGSPYLTHYLEEFIKWRYAPHRILNSYRLQVYEKGQVMPTLIEG